MTEGSTHAMRSLPLSTSYIPDGNPGPLGGGTYTNYPTEPSIRDYENVFGPGARDIKDDLQKYKRHGRWHLPDILKGPNPWLTDRIDGLITDATNSPFTSYILPYKYFDNVDGKIKWNVWSFDEAMASRVPYEAAARTLTQSKRSYAGYAVRHGLAINLEHNFMMTPQGRENFQNQLQQLIGSIQYSNDLDVHMALILAPSYEKIQREKYYGDGKNSSQICREFVDLFGFMQKNQNALDILIEESKIRLKSWGGPMPDFMLTNSKLGFQLQMIPERTNYLTQGPDGAKRLKQGPEISTYRGLKIIHTRAFSLETGVAPRDMLRRRVRVAEYYRIPPSDYNVYREFEFYNEARDNWFSLTFLDLLRMAKLRIDPNDALVAGEEQLPGNNNATDIDYIINVLSGRDMVGMGAAAAFGKPRSLGGRVTTLGGGYSAEIGARYGRRTGGYLAGPADPGDPLHRFYQEILQEVSKDDTWKNVLKWAADGEVLSRQDILDGEYNYSSGVIFKKSGVIFISPGRSVHIGSKRLIFKDTDGVIDAVVDHLTNDGKGNKAKKSSKSHLADQVLSFYPPKATYTSSIRKMYQKQQDCHTIDDFRRLMKAGTEKVFRRIFYRNGIPIDSFYGKGPETLDVYNEENYFLQPLGAFLEPNCIGHLDNISDKHMRILNECLLFTDDVVNILMNPAVIDLLFSQPASVDRVPGQENKWIGMFGAVMESFNESLNIGECSVKFCDRLKQLFPDISHTNPKPDQSFLVWTLPSFRGQEACTLCDISNRNCIHRFHATLYQKILESNGDIPGHTLTSELITNMLGVDEETKKNLRSEPTYPIFYAITDAVKKEFDRYSLNNDLIKVFQKSFSQRLFRDAYPFIIKRSASKKPDFSYYRSKYWNDLPPSVWNFQSVKKSIDPNPSYHTLRVPVTPMISHELRPRPAGAGEVSIEEMLRDCDIMDDILAATGHPDESSGGLDGDDGPSGGGDEEYHDTEDGEDWPSDDPPSYPEPPRHHGGSGGSGGSGGPGGSGGSGGPGGSGPSGPPPGPLGPAPGPLPPGASELTKNIEIVILRPNIEHYMLGIIMGLAGENLGNTLWGQTELSVYDDAMHGVWGMSYKYHERAIVFNEKNLIRLWDVAYDGYNGGKEEKHVNWEQDHEVRRFREDTLDVTKNYQGASMMVLAFCHDPVKQFKGRNVYDDHFKRNWPSPILFDDNYDHEHLQSHEARSIVGYDNLHVVDVEEFRVFNNPLYSAYSAYRRMFPPFMELHKTRKSAGESTQEAETTTESLAFQGTMRIKEHGCVKTEIRGSGHHGADFVGAASIRAGKGYKMNIGQPALGHLV